MIGSAEKNVQVKNVPPLAVISGPTEGNEDQWLEFSSLGSSDTISDQNTLIHRWYIGSTEGSYSEGYSLQKTFDKEGTYDIILVVLDDDGDAGTEVHKVSIENLAPTAFFEDPGSPAEDEVLLLDGGGSTDTPSDLQSLQFAWDLDGDLVYDVEGKRVNASWGRSGTYLVTLKVTDNNGDFDTISKTITVINLPPMVELLGPASGREDEMIDIVINGNIDTFSDRDDLQILWYVDGSLFEGEGPHISLSFSKKGTHTVEAVVIDDQGATGNDTLVLSVVNPPPIVHVDNIPTEVTQGESFTAKGHRSTDTLSDIPNLTFQWFLDGVPIPDGNGQNITLKPGKVGQRDLSLRVIDDEGASTEVNVTFNVVAVGTLDVIVDTIFSSFSLALLLAFILVMFFGVYRFRKDMKALPEPQGKEDQVEEQEKEEGQDEPVITSKEQKEAPEEGSNILEEETFVEEIEDPDLPELEEPRELPPPPDMGSVEVPGVDDSIFGEPPEH
jgi:hypothetical protein